LHLGAESCIRIGLKSHATDISFFGWFFLLSTLLKPGAAYQALPAIFLPKENTMPIGTVKFFNLDKGYGFIQPEGSGNDAFVHISAVERAGMTTLNKDQRVSYDLEQDQRGKTSAVNLQSA
jgi:CspA family cold shock protein